MYLLDTNICIYFMKNKYPNLTRKFLSCSNKDLFLSSITLYELEYGINKSKWVEKNRLKLYSFLAPLNILPFTVDDAIYAGQIRANLEKQGNIIGPYDIQIAAQALSRNLALVTHNVDEFKRVKELKIEDWLVD